MLHAMYRHALFLLLLATTVAAQQPSAPAHAAPPPSLEQLIANAQQALPPFEKITQMKRPDLVQVNSLDPSIKVDFPLATSNNLLRTQIYHKPKAYLERPAAEALVKANQDLRKLGFGLLIYDAYQPWWVTKLLWSAMSPQYRQFLGDPTTGTIQNRACGVDLTLYDVKTGRPEPMPSAYDELNGKASPSYAGGDQQAQLNRSLLITTMQKYGFTVSPTKWWHFEYKDWQKYPVLNIGFQDVPPPQTNDPCVCQDPVPISTPDAPYTEEARKARINGTVRSWMFLGADGVPRQIIVFKPLGHGLDQKVISTLMNWRFEPANLDDKPIPQLLSIDSNFHYHPGFNGRLPAAKPASALKKRATPSKK